MSFAQYLDEPEIEDRFIEGALNDKKNGDVTIKNFTDFKDALFNYLEFDYDKGKHVSSLLNENDIIRLFKNQKIRDEIEDNTSKAEADKLYGFVDVTEAEVIRRKPIGKPVRHTQVYASIIPKPVSVHRYSTKRAKSGFAKQHVRGKPRRWIKDETDFLKEKKSQNISATQIAYMYNRDKRFMTNPRSESSVKTKLYRL
ncbi:MAG: hypothetical protein ACFFDN_06935 [Candidatus Hodarchaeota archaeon]